MVPCPEVTQEERASPPSRPLTVPSLLISVIGLCLLPSAICFLPSIFSKSFEYSEFVHSFEPTPAACLPFRASIPAQSKIRRTRSVPPTPFSVRRIGRRASFSFADRFSLQQGSNCASIYSRDYHRRKRRRIHRARPANQSCRSEGYKPDDRHA